ncbi:MAG: hypothetical protein K0Q72_2445 [Armatimonadetes bacterium]|nr:hypothetical protein [Armatimonadota bacterium]
MVAEAADVSAGALHLAAYRELPPEQRRWTSGLLPRAADPLAAPVRLLRQPHLPTSHRAPGGGATVAVPDPHLPPARLRRRERLPSVGHLRGAVRRHAAAIPEVAPVPPELGLAAGHQHLVSGLALSPLPGLQQPPQPGVRGVQPDRVLQVLAFQAGHLHRLPGGVPSGRAQHHQRRQCGQAGDLPAHGGCSLPEIAPGARGRPSTQFKGEVQPSPVAGVARPPVPSTIVNPPAKPQ